MFANLTRRTLSLALAIALAAAIALPAAAGGRHHGGDQWIGTGAGRGNHPGSYNRGNWGGHQNRGNWNRGYRHRGGGDAGLAIGLGLGALMLGLGAAAASQQPAQYQTCYPHGCHTFEYGQWVWRPR